MKKQFTPFIFLLFSVTTITHLPQHDGGTVSITNLSTHHVVIEIDGRKYTDCNNSITVQDIAPGYHLIKIFGDAVSTFRPTVLYNKNTYLKPRFYVDMVINRFGRVLIDEQPLNNGWGGGNNGNNGNNNQQPSRPPRPEDNAPRAVSDETFAAMKETIRRESFDDSRLSIARSIIDQNYFTAAQAKELTQLFVFEANKLAIAKYMYGKTIDRKNYFIVYPVFTFAKTKDELAEYIRSYQ
jgi:hypothetical protein